GHHRAAHGPGRAAGALSRRAAVGRPGQDGGVGHFFDWQDGGPLRLELRSIDGRDFTLLRRIGYRSRRYDEPFGVPADPEHFTTDLASVPWMFGWLVPRSGEFTPAAVLHDGLVLPGGYLGP